MPTPLQVQQSRQKMLQMQVFLSAPVPEAAALSSLLEEGVCPSTDTFGQATLAEPAQTGRVVGVRLSQGFADVNYGMLPWAAQCGRSSAGAGASSTLHGGAST